MTTVVVFVMPGPVPGIHVFLPEVMKGGLSAAKPTRTTKTHDVGTRFALSPPYETNDCAAKMSSRVSRG